MDTKHPKSTRSVSVSLPNHGLPPDLVIAMIGPIACAGKVAAGGYEAANRRTIDLLRSYGLKVIEIPYPTIQASAFVKLAAYGEAFSSILWQLAKLRRAHPTTPFILHLTALYRQFAYGEYAILRWAKGIGFRVVYDIRAGQFIDCFEGRSQFYRLTIRQSLLLSDRTMVEGKAYQFFIEALGNPRPFYFPNYVDDDQVKVEGKDDPRRTLEPIRLLYFGRVVPAKNVATVIDTLDVLVSRGINATLDIVGPGDQTYIARLRESLSFPDRVFWLGPRPHQELLTSLPDYHFFVFPTRYIGEGQSNALTEAMAKGVVPICSNTGFSADLVAGCGELLEPNASGNAYADAVLRCMDGDWWSYSDRCLTRIQTQFAASAIAPSLLDEYSKVAGYE